MTNTSMLVRAGSCIPGGQTRDTGSIRTTERYDPANPFTTYGLFGKIAAPTVNGSGVVTAPGGAFVPLVGGETIGQIAGALARAVPNVAAVGDTMYAETPEYERVTQVAQVHREGFFGVHCASNASPYRDGPVFIRVANPSTGKPLGGVEAVADATAGNTLQLPGARFCGGVDAMGNVEIFFRRIDGIN